MPLYEYECASCGKRFELVQKFSAPPEAACPACGGRGHRQLSAPALHFKGSGWTVSDYARRNADPQSGKSSPEPGAPASKSDGATGSGAAAAAPAKPAVPVKTESK